MPKKTVSKTTTAQLEPNGDYAIYQDELEFSREADRLIEAIEQRRTRLGQTVDKSTTLKIANAILERRIND